MKDDEKKPVYPNEFVEDKSILVLGDRGIEFSQTPGHTHDSIVASLKNECIMAAGDTMMELGGSALATEQR